MPKNKTFHSFAKWFRRLSLILIAAPLALIITYAIFIATGGTTKETIHNNADKAIQVIIIINAVASILWFFLAIVMFFAAGTLRSVGVSPLAIRVGLIITFALVFAEIILSLLFHFKPEIQGQSWVPWVQTFMPLINISGYIVGAVVGTKLKNGLA